MDAELRQVVIGRALGSGQIEPATIGGFRRVLVAGRNYPMLLPHPTGRVEGMLAHGLEEDEVRRLVLFEGGEYRLRPVAVTDLRGQRIDAAAFLADRERADRRAWTLERWQRRHKRAFVRQAEAFMRRGLKWL